MGVKSNKKRLLAIIFILVIATIAFFLGWSLRQSQISNKDISKYPLLSKRLFVENQNDIILNLAPLRVEVRKYLQEIGIAHSFYMEYLPSGTSIRVGDNDQFIGASLMKIPVVMDLYKAVELGKLRLDQEIVITDQATSDKFGLLWKKGVGAKISLGDAVKLSIKESDNTAARLILEQTSKALDPRVRSLNFLDTEISETEINNQPTIYISARGYTSFIKCLYLSCYLNYEDSQAILELLTQTDFHQRIEAGINDKSIKIAHKIGTFSSEVSSDCGIVYAPRRPYSICLMINSTNTTVDKYFADISTMVYEYISSINPTASDL